MFLKSIFFWTFWLFLPIVSYLDITINWIFSYILVYFFLVSLISSSLKLHILIVYLLWAELSEKYTDKDLSLSPQEAASLVKSMEKWTKMRKSFCTTWEVMVVRETGRIRERNGSVRRDIFTEIKILVINYSEEGDEELSWSKRRMCKSWEVRETCELKRLNEITQD